MYKEQLIAEMLLLPNHAIDYHVGKHLAELFPGKGIIEDNGGCLSIEPYAKAGYCSITRKAIGYNQVGTYWLDREPETMRGRHMHMMGMGMIVMDGMSEQFVERMETQQEETQSDTADYEKRAWLEVKWQDQTLDILVLTLEHQRIQWIIAESQEIARSFLATVCKWNAEIRSEVLVFDNGHWFKDEHLFHDIKGATFENLITRGNLKQEIRDDLVQFFASRAIYDEHDVPWKRGILFVGPAGNGKTHAVKALLNSLTQPCLYVKSFRDPNTHGIDEFNIRQVFSRARRSAPCLLVLEDLDALITEQNRSFFLNEIDGFAANIGIVTLATTNHPERLDPAIINRPSRFDRKYPFDLPALSERRAYINMWNESLKESLRLSEEGVAKIAELADGFSFAYLKELFLSSKMRWIANPQQGTMETVMSGQVETLREQMISPYVPAEEVPTEAYSGASAFLHGGMGGVYIRRRM